MGLINDNRKLLVLAVRPNQLQYLWELMDGRDDNLLAANNHLPQVIALVCPAHRTLLLHELPDGVAYLLIQIHTVCHYDNRVKHRCRSPLQRYQLVGQPSYGV